MRASLFVCAFCAAPAFAQAPAGPVLYDVVPGDVTAAYHFRFVDPALADDLAHLDGSELEARMADLCIRVALPHLNGAPAQEVVISIDSAQTPFGEAAPDIVRVFEAYAIEGETCVWLAF